MTTPCICIHEVTNPLDRAFPCPTTSRFIFFLFVPALLPFGSALSPQRNRQWYCEQTASFTITPNDNDRIGPSFLPNLLARALSVAHPLLISSLFLVQRKNIGDAFLSLPDGLYFPFAFSFSHPFRFLHFPVYAERESPLVDSNCTQTSEARRQPASPSPSGRSYGTRI